MGHPASGANGANGADGEKATPLVLLGVPRGFEASRQLSGLAPRELDLRTVEDLPALLSLVPTLQPDLVIVDVTLFPHDVVRGLLELRRAGRMRMIVVGAEFDSSLRAEILWAGADDCLSTPYVSDELLARMEAVLSRELRREAERAAVTEPGVLVAGPIEVDLRGHVVRVDGREVALTAREFALLAYLVSKPEVAHTRAQLLAQVWGYTFGGVDTVTVHVRRLRSKIEPDPSRPRWIQTVWGLGYRFSPEG